MKLAREVRVRRCLATTAARWLLLARCFVLPGQPIVRLQRYVASRKSIRERADEGVEGARAHARGHGERALRPGAGTDTRADPHSPRSLAPAHTPQDPPVSTAQPLSRRQSQRPLLDQLVFRSPPSAPPFPPLPPPQPRLPPLTSPLSARSTRHGPDAFRARAGQAHPGGFR